MTNEGGLMDYRDVGELASYVAERDSRDSYSGVSECPECGRLFETPDFDVCECWEGDEFFSICPECGSLVKHVLYFYHDFIEHRCTPGEWERGTGERLPHAEGTEDEDQ